MRWSSTRTRKAANLALVALVASACGSTVSAGRFADSAGGSSLGGALSPLTSQVGGEGSSTTGDGSSAGPTTGATSGPSGAGTSQAAGSSAGSTGSSGAGGSSSGSGSSSTHPTGPLSLGIMTFQPTAGNPALAAFKNVPKVDPEKDYNAIISYFNAHGGFGGRKAVPVIYQEPLTSTESADSILQAECEDFTQDHHVSIVLSDRGNDRTPGANILSPCLIKAGIPYIYDFPGYYAEEHYPEPAGSDYSPSLPDEQTIFNSWIAGLIREKYLSNVKTPKVGILMPDTSSAQKHVNQTIRPDLKAIGLTISDEGTFTSGSNNQSSQIQSDTLRFKSEGITHVLIIETDGFEVSESFMQDAETQQYFPRYGLTSVNDANYLRQQVNAKQLQNAVGISWTPLLDVGPGAQPADNSSERQCEAIYQAAGITIADQNTKAVLMYICGLVQFLHAAMVSDPVLSFSGIQPAIASLGTSWVSPRCGPTDFGPGVFAGPSEYRDMVYDPKLGYFVYDDQTFYKFVRFTG